MKSLHIIAVAALLVSLPQPSGAGPKDGTEARTAAATNGAPANSMLRDETSQMQANKKLKDQSKKLNQKMEKSEDNLNAQLSKSSKSGHKGKSGKHKVARAATKPTNSP
jgi:hypothetical protein